MWPRANATTIWQHLVGHLYASLTQQPILWCPASGGRWLAPAAATWPDDRVKADDQLRAALVALGVPLPQVPDHASVALMAYMVRRCCMTAAASGTDHLQVLCTWLASACACAEPCRS
jgi:hypothetical protein